MFVQSLIMIKVGGVIDNFCIMPPQKLIEVSFEKIFICVSREFRFRAIKEQLLDMGIAKEKIVTMSTSKEYQDAFIELDPIRKKWIKAFADYTKNRGLSGSIAECGVFYGETAMFMNKYWSNRTLHLFDTFEGFEEEDIAYESDAFCAFKNGQFIKNPFKVDKPEIQIEIVKNRMSYPENLKIHKGYFPNSTDGVEDRFCFVNLDMDLYQPQLEGLRFFWNRMVNGGAILLHDYFHPELPGVQVAVEDFEKELNRNLPKIPIGDFCSIAIIKCD